jgi:MFS transporter, MHS family, alpha-ketoglutarate permease
MRPVGSWYFGRFADRHGRRAALTFSITSINAIVKAELFPFPIRALGVGWGYAVANSLFGGTSPVIYEVAKAAGQVPLFIAYVTVCIALSLAIYALRNKSETPLDAEQGFAYESAR